MRLRRDWRDDAACRGKATANFDPWDPPGTAYNVPRDAQRFCDGCAVRVECLADSFHHDDQGVRGGTTMRQRKAMKRPRLRLACPVCRGRLTEPTLTDRQLIQLCPGCGLSWRTRRPTTRRPATTTPEGEAETRATHDQAVPQPG